jgi:hypothetical protein
MKHWMLFIFCVLGGSIATATPDTCAVNDVCETATIIQGVYSDQSFICVISCNTGATPELFENACDIDITPTTWFAFETDGEAALLNIHVRSEDVAQPVIAVYRPMSNCSNLMAVPLTFTRTPCVIGVDGSAMALGTEVGAGQQYFIAISSLTGKTGNFELCINTVSVSNACVTQQNIEVTARSEPGPLSGPFEPGETVSICMNVISYTAANNGCQWFQGLVPVFGNGWDPGSFDDKGQPWGATMNGINMGSSGNGLYSTSTWDWFDNVDYHHHNALLQIGDLDSNGRRELCNVLYDINCPNLGGLQGGCCGPCWGAPPGDLLPGGWFAYGINGSCPSIGPPIGFDWGDGNTCGYGMGPWRICFDLITRSEPDCMLDPSTNDLSLGFYTFADGQIGGWSGFSSVCGLDQPASLKLSFRCNEDLIDLGIDTSLVTCTGDSLIYMIDYPGVDTWTWSIFPHGYVEPPLYEALNGFTLKQMLTNSFGFPRTITYTFTGHDDTGDDIVVKRIRATIMPAVLAVLPDDMLLCERDSKSYRIIPNVGGQGDLDYLWEPTGETTFAIYIRRPFPETLILSVTDEFGCHRADTMKIKTRPCHLGDTIPSTEDDNDPDHPMDPPPPVENLADPDQRITIRNASESAALFSIMPVPAKDRIVISLAIPLTLQDRIVVFDVSGHPVLQLDMNTMSGTMNAVDISQLTDGIYYITLFMPRSTVTHRMVKL